ncbi:MAG TPA: hypothetical protein DEF30_08360 [Proteiniclasticum sp.]|uniref:hypothetical protein n=1 Tax=Proteiniclasticum sp. TaxID=2053595 RepID=UPI000E87D7CA|nr:hypothetical protein [Proteiniclasticum sp.]HBW13813.1 hypothetical protein [Proteiniclasticum sp.]
MEEIKGTPVATINITRYEGITSGEMEGALGELLECVSYSIKVLSDEIGCSSTRLCLEITKAMALWEKNQDKEEKIDEK